MSLIWTLEYCRTILNNKLTEMKNCGKINCKLCYNSVRIGSFKLIEETIKEVLDILLPKLSIIENESVICDACLVKLFAAFHFKATCTDNEDSIFPYINTENAAPVDLKEIYLIERGKEHLKGILDDKRICRLCMQVVTCEFTFVKEVNFDMLHEYIPEINFNSTKEPVVCKTCLDLLHTHVNFLKNCLDVMTDVKDICDSKVREGQQHLLTEVKLELNLDEHDRNSLKDCLGIKQEVENISESKVPEGQLHLPTKTVKLELKFEETDIDVSFPDLKGEPENASKYQLQNVKTTNKSILRNKKKQHKSKDKPDGLSHGGSLNMQTYKCGSCDFKTIYKWNVVHHQITHQVVPEERMYKCESCDFKTVRKGTLKHHQLKHKSTAEMQMYKCDSCDFKTIHKWNLANHERRHQVIPAEQMHKCKSCDFKTVRKSTLKNHQLRHDNAAEMRTYKCDSCDFKTLYKWNLIHHQARHQVVPKVQTYKCESCDYKTVKKNNLKYHQLRHKNIAEVQMHKCSSCDFKTIYKWNLVHHQARHQVVVVE